MPPFDDLRKGRHSEAHRAYFITTVLANRQSLLFTDLLIARLIVAEMRTLHESGAVDSFAWVVMPDHLHWLFQLGENIDLSTLVKSLKARSAHRVNQRLNRQGPLWQKSFHDHAIREEEDIKQIARYIVANPLRAGLVQNIGDYPLWDAAWL
jgi:REP element-mobilizing transposase RayT